MKVTPKIMGTKNKSIRIDPDELDEFRKNLRANPKWAKYAKSTDSELVRMALIFGNIHVDPRVMVAASLDVALMVSDAVVSNITKVAAALGAVAQMNQDGTISLVHPDWDSVQTFDAEAPKERPKALLH